MITVCSTAGWASEETIHPGPSAHSDHQGQRMWPEGPRGGFCTHSRHISPGPGGAHGSPQVCTSHKQGRLQQLLLSEHRWRHSKSRTLCLAGQLGLQLPVPAEMKHSPLLPALGTGAAPKENQQQPSLPALRGFVGRTNFSSTTLDLLYLGNIRNLEGLFLESEEL